MTSPGGIHLTSYLTDLASPSASRHGPLFTCNGIHTTVAEARNRVLTLSHAFYTRIGLLPGDRVCFLAQGTPCHLEGLLATIAAGCIAAPLNWRWSVHEVSYALEHIQATVLCADEACLSLAKQVMETCPGLRHLIFLGEGAASFKSSSIILNGSSINDTTQKLAKFQTFSSAEVLIEECSKNFPAAYMLSSPDNIHTTALMHPSDGAAFIIFTSGTSGPPRAAVLSHAALHFQCEAKLHYCGYSANDVYLHTAQLFHVGGLCSAFAMLRAGAYHVFQPTFKAAQCLEDIDEYKVTSFIAVPTMIADIVGAAKNIGKLSTITQQEQGKGEEIIIIIILPVLVSLFVAFVFSYFVVTHHSTIYLLVSYH